MSTKVGRQLLQKQRPKLRHGELPKENCITGGIPQGLVLGPLLWNVMYDGPVKFEFPIATRLVAFADEVAMIIVAKH